MMDNKGNIALEIAIVMIVILIISGFVLNYSEIMTQKAVKSSETENGENLLSEVVDNLINNPGIPENWEKYEKGTPGLAIINEHGEVIPNSVSYVKFIVLGENYKKLVDKKLFDSKVKTSLELIPQESSISSVKIGDENEAGDVFSVNRLVKCDFYKKYVIKDFQYQGKCNHRHNQDKYSCNYFKIFEGNLRKSNYYLLLDSKDNINYIVDTTRAAKQKGWQSPSSDKICINDEINFYDDTSAIVFIHFDKPNTKAVLVSVPKNFDRNKLNYDYFRINDCNLILKAWY